MHAFDGREEGMDRRKEIATRSCQIVPSTTCSHFVQHRGQRQERARLYRIGDWARPFNGHEKLNLQNTQSHKSHSQPLLIASLSGNRSVRFFELFGSRKYSIQSSSLLLKLFLCLSSGRIYHFISCIRFGVEIDRRGTVWLLNGHRLIKSDFFSSLCVRAVHGGIDPKTRSEFYKNTISRSHINIRIE